MNKEVNKKQIRIVGGGEEYITRNEFFREVGEIKNDVKEIKKTVIPSNQGKKEDTKITKLKILEDRLVAQLNDSRELSIPIDWFAKWGVKGVNASKLKNYEIWRGKNIYFPKINEVLGVEKFINGFDASC